MPPVERVPLAEPIIVQIGEEAERIRQWAACGEHRISLSRGDAALALARVLVKAGYDPARRYEVWRGNMRCLTYRSLKVAAGLMVLDPDDGRGMRFAKYRPGPDERASMVAASQDARNDIGEGNDTG